MRLNHWLVSLTLFALSTPVAAQEYTWTDERGNVHMASDPSEIPARYRNSAVHAGGADSSRVRIVPMEPAAAPKAADKTAGKTPDPRRREAAERTKRWNEEREASLRAKSARDDEERREAARERREAFAENPPDSSSPDAQRTRGFRKVCDRVDSDGNTECRLEENEERAAQRMQDAYDKAYDDLGVDEQDVRDDPGLRREIERRALEDWRENRLDPHSSDYEGGPDED